MTGGADQDWDVCFLAKASRINDLLADAIRDKSISLPQISWASNDGVSLQATIASLAFATRGTANGTDVPTVITLKSGTYQDPDGSADLAGFTFGCNLDLRQVDQPELVSFRIGSSQSITIEILDRRSVSEDAADFVQSALGLALPIALKDFRPTIAKLDLGSQGVRAKWLVPRAMGHGYVGVTDAPPGTFDDDVGVTDDAQASPFQSAYFTVMAMVDPFKTGNPPPLEVPSRDILPPGCDAAIGISEATLMRHVMLPALVQGLYGSRTALSQADADRLAKTNFVLSSRDTVIQSKPGLAAIPVKTVDVDLSLLYTAFGGVVFIPPALVDAIIVALGITITELITHQTLRLIVPMEVSIEGLELRQVNGKLRMKAQVCASLQLGSLKLADVRMTTESDLAIKATGGSFGLIAENFTHTTPSVSAPDWLPMTKKVAEVFLTLAGLIISVATEGTAAVALALALAEVKMALNALPILLQASLNKGVGTQVPADLGSFVASVATPVSFLDNGTFHAKTAVLDGNLVIGGDLVSQPAKKPEPSVVRRSGPHWAVE